MKGKKDNRSSLKVSLPAVFLDPVDPKMFENPQLSAFEVYAKAITEFPNDPSLIERINKVRLINCKLLDLPPGLTFYSNVTHLDLIENCFTSFPKNVFMSFPELLSLDLTSNSIIDLDVSLPESLMTLDVSYNKGFNLQSIWKTNLPNLTTLKVTHCGISSLPDEPPAFAASLKSLFLDGNSFEEIPKVISQMPSLEELGFFGNKLIKTTNEQLPQSFKQVNLCYNDITEWTYEHKLEATTVNLSSNPITEFPVRVLDVTNMRALILSKCGIKGVIDFELPQTVVFLDIARNEVSGLSERFVASMKTLSMANFSHNMIEEIPDCFPQGTFINKLHIDGNRIRELPASLLQAPRLEQFTASSNRLTEVKEFKLPHLRVLNLSFNKLKELPNCFADSPLLTDLNVSFNMLENLPKSLSCCRKLWFLVAARNRFLRVPECVISFSGLKTLVLSGNKLTSVPAALGSFFFLKTLDLSNNCFQTMPEEISKLMALKFLSMSHNAIESLREGFTLPEQLTLVDFSFNKLKAFGISLPKALSVNLDYNQITSFNYDLVPSVRFLALSHNPIEMPLIEQLPTACALKDLRCLEYIGNENEPKEIPPMRLHVLDNSTCHCGNTFGIGYAATLGERPTMEDSVIFGHFPEDQFLYGVFDGHTGNVSSSSSANCLMNEMKRVVTSDDSDLEASFSKCFTKINEKLKLINVRDGCTAAASFIRKNHCFATGVGDSRIIRVKSDGVERLTTDYKPLNRSEFLRLRESGLSVNTEGRINRKLAVARSLGDFWIGDGIFVEPEVSHFEIQDNDIAMVIACDGLWDVISDEEAAEIVREAKTAADAAVSLKNYAFALGSKDNISVIVVYFHPDEMDKGFVSRNTVELIPVVVEEPEPTIEMNFPQLPALGRRRR